MPDEISQLIFNKRIALSKPRKQGLASNLPVQSFLATFGRFLAETRRFLHSFLRYLKTFLCRFDQKLVTFGQFGTF